MTFSTLGLNRSASSTIPFNGNTWPLIQAPSAVMTSLLSEALTRSCRASALYPAKTTEWTAPILAQASMAKWISGIRGR